jgi:ATP-dependent DNA helicase RecG
MKNWENRALALLDKSLVPVPSELNELDWKSNLSDKSERLAQHLSAFTHLPGGGFMVFGVDNTGRLQSLDKTTIDEIIKKLGNIARNNLAQPVSIDHTVIRYNEADVLIAYIPESINKPVHLRGETLFSSYKRSAGQTVKMSVEEVKALIAQSHGLSFEDQITLSSVKADEVIELLDYDAYFRLSQKQLPDNKLAILDILENEEAIRKNENGTWDITNLGAILFARDLRSFKELRRKAIRVIQYKGTSKIDAIKEQEGTKGYAAGFEGLVKYIMDQIPTNEVIESAIRKQVKMYPEKAVREFVANALIHQDFSITGTAVMIEIFNDRIEITNPGIPLIDTNRFIDTAPKSRNEALASLLRRLNICEERGSGIDRAIASIEVFQLPAPKFIKETDYTRVIMYAHRSLSKMDKDDRVRACYQHCCLQYVNNQATNNQSVRKRFSITEPNYPMASRIISDTIDAGLIKPTDPDSNSRKHAAYKPFWA